MTRTSTPARSRPPPEFLAALHDVTTLYDAEDADPHWSDSFDTYADFMAAANDPNLGNSDDSDPEK